jgi:hypothetical protein
VRNAKCTLMVSAYLLLSATNVLAGSSGRGCWACPLGTKSQPLTPQNVASTSTSKSPSLATKMSDGTKRLASGTKNLFTAKKPTSRGMSHAQSSKFSRDEKPGLLKSMFNPEPPPPPKTIKEWMSLKQVHP